MLTINAHLYKSMYIVGLENLLFKGFPFVTIYKQYVLHTTQTNGLKDRDETYSACRNQIALNIKISDIQTKECYGFIALKQSRIEGENYLTIKEMDPNDKARYILSTDPRSVAKNPYLIDDMYGTLSIEEGLLEKMLSEEKETRKELEEIKKMILVRN